MSNIIKKENSQPATFGSVVDQIFQNNLSRFFDDETWGFGGVQTRGQVPVNIRETDSYYEMEIVAPGLKKQDFQINLTGDQLTISFEQKEESSQDNKDKGWLRKEYRKRSFSRSFTIDDTVDSSKSSAKYEDGILHLTLPKKENARQVSRSINVQ